MKRLSSLVILLLFLAVPFLQATSLEGAIYCQGNQLSVSGTEAAGNVPRMSDAFSKWLGKGSRTYGNYLGSVDGEYVYTGITNSFARREAEWAGVYKLEQLNAGTLTRGEARCIEQAIIANNPNYRNLINSISPTRSFYDEAVTWGTNWLKDNGLGSLLGGN